MKTITVMIGLPGCGKSTHTRIFGAQVVSRDIIRQDLGIIGTDGKKCNGTPEQEKEITEEWNKKFQDLVSDGKSFVIDDTNLNPKFRIPLIKRIKDSGYKAEAIIVYRQFENCVAEREEIPLPVMERMNEFLSEISQKTLKEEGFDNVKIVRNLF